MKISSFSNDFFLEKLIASEDTLDVTTKFNLPTKYVCFFLDQNRGTEDAFSGYVHYNKEELERNFNDLGYKFFIISNEVYNKEAFVLNFYKTLVYHFPFLDIPELNFFEWLTTNKSFSLGENSVLLKHNNPSQKWSGGFFCNNEEDLSFFPTSYSDLTTDKFYFRSSGCRHNFTNNLIEQAVSEYLNFLDAENYLKGQLDDRAFDENIVYSPPEVSPVDIDYGEDFAPSPKIDDDTLYSPSFKSDDFESLDEETIQKIKEVERNLEHLKSSGNFVFVAPLLEAFLKEKKVLDKIKEPPYDLYISPSDFRITIPDLNVEIKMNALTKAVYFLFLSCRKGIDLNNRYLYKEYLLKIYLAISNKTDVDAMKQSVDAVADFNNSNLIYMHISRIKSAFKKQFNDDLASYYYIQGKRGGDKHILLDSTTQTNIDSLNSIWGECPNRYDGMFEL